MCYVYRLLHKTAGMLPLAVVILIPWFISGMPVTKVPQNTEPPLPDTTEKPTEVGCIDLDGKWYPAGSEVSRGSDGNGWCYGLFCSHDGSLTPWDNFNCKPTTTGPATSTTDAPTTTTAPTPTTVTTPVGCFQNGIWYEPGSVISQGSNGEGWCYGTYCTDDSQVAALDDWKCKITTTGPVSSSSILAPTSTPIPTTSSTPSPTTVPPPLGCFQNGAWYEPGSEINRASNGEGWCHGLSCDTKGKIVAWDDWNCEDTEVGCIGLDGKWYPAGSEVSRGSDGNGWCYGIYCSHSGGLIAWDDFNCKPTIADPATSTVKTHD